MLDDLKFFDVAAPLMEIYEEPELHGLIRDINRKIKANGKAVLKIKNNQLEDYDVDIMVTISPANKQPLKAGDSNTEYEVD